MSANEVYDAFGERGYVSTCVIPDQYTDIRVRKGKNFVSVEIGSVSIHVSEDVLDRLDQAILDARAALASTLAAAVSA